MTDEKKTEVIGAFQVALQRNNSKIRKDRAEAISEDTQLVYKRAVEDMEIKIKKLKRDRENMLDLSPTDATSLVLASDFNAEEYIDKDIEIGVKLRNLEIRLEIAKERYEYLFGGVE